MLRFASFSELSVIVQLIMYTQVNGHEYQAYVGETVSLKCSTQEDTAPDWTFKASGAKLREVAREGEVINGWNDRGTTVRREKSGEYILQILQVGVNDTGTFRCIEEAGLGNVHEFPLRVSDEPVMYPVYTAGVGQTVMLPCFTSLDAKIDWKFKSSSRPAPNEIAREGAIINGWVNRSEIHSGKPGDYSLVINNLQLNDTGKYTCVEDEGIGDQHVHYVRVSDTSDNTVVRTVQGTPVAFVCMLRNTSRFRWQYDPGEGDMTLLYNGYKVQDQSGRLSVTCDIDRCILVISKVVGSDAGAYVCSSSDASSIRQQFQLDIDRVETGPTETAEDNSANVVIIVPVIVSAVIFVIVVFTVVFCVRRHGMEHNNADKEANKHLERQGLLPEKSADQSFKLMRTISLDSSKQFLYGIAELHPKLWFILRSLSGSEYEVACGDGLNEDDPHLPRGSLYQLKTSKITIMIDDVSSLTDIAACHMHRVVYVAGFCGSYSSEGRVWRINPDDYQIDKFLPQGEPGIRFKPQSLSVNSGRLLVTSQLLEELTLHDVDGRTIAVIPLRNKEPTHAIEVANRSFVVCCLKPEFAVCHFDAKGALLGSYNGTLNNPSYLALDPNGRVFLADSDNNRIVVLKPDLVEDQVVECPVEMVDQNVLKTWPWQMCYEASTAQLLVTGAMSCDLRIFACVDFSESWNEYQ